MMKALGFIVFLFALLAPDLAAAQSVSASEKRLAIVIGNAGYQAGALATPANDAGLIAQTLQASGFDVVGARDLDQDTLRRAFRDFLDKAEAAGPNTVAFIYLGGYGLQLEGENYFLPIDAKIARDADIVAQAVRISDYIRPLAALNLKASVVVVDAARPHPFARSGAPLPGGLALVEPDPGMLVAFNAAPDTVAPEGKGPYGPYAQALAEMMREGGLSLPGLFDRVRLRVNEITRGGQIPWHASKVQEAFVFFELTPDAPAPAISVEQTSAWRARPIRQLQVQDAYVAALERDTLDGYLDFLAAYPEDPMARRVRGIVAARREAITWRRTRNIDTPDAYWSYLSRYPRGRHAGEARRRLRSLAAELEPPASFTIVDYDVAPPLPEEVIYIERPVLIFDDPVYGFELPPPIPIFFLPPRPAEFFLLPPPPPPLVLFVLPIPVFRPVPIWVRPPLYVVAPPANNIIFNNIHNTVVINNTTNIVTITKPDGQTTTQTTTMPTQGRTATTSGAPTTPAAVVGPALPPSLAQRAVQSPQLGTQAGPQNQPTTQQRLQNQPGTQQPSQPGQPLPGIKGLPLPAAKRAAPATGVQPGPGPQQGSQRHPGQALPKGPAPPLAKGTPPAETLQSGQSLEQKKGRPQTGQAPQPGQSVSKGKSLPATKSAPAIGTQPQQQQLGPSDAQKQLEQQRLRQIQQQRQQQLEHQRQIELQRQHQLEQQRQKQIEQQRQQQLEQQRQQQIQQQRQQVEQQRQQQIQQRQQQLQQQQRQQQIQQPRPQPPAKQQCGGPQQPACPK